MVERLHDIVEIGGGRIANFLGLPVGESVDETKKIVNGVIKSTGLHDSQQLDTTSDDRVGSPIGVLVPAVGGTDQSIWKHLLNLVDLLEKFISGEIATVQRFRSNCDSIDSLLVAGDRSLKGCFVGREGLFGVWPV